MTTATLTRPASRTAPAVGAVVAYCRISKDGDGRGLGVERQVEDVTRLAASLGLTLLPQNIVIENDTGASIYSTKPRPLWADVVRRVELGEVTHVLAYSLSRLTRQMIEREELLNLRHLGASILTAQGQRIAPGMAAMEVQMIRMIGVSDTGETDVMSERLTRKFQQNAADGQPHGPIAYGWDRHHERNGLVVDTINEAQADVLREVARRMIAGDATRAIARDLNDRGIPAPRGGKWSTTILTKLMLRPRNIAQRVHQGVVVETTLDGGRAAWAPLYDDDTHAAVVAHLRDPQRLKPRGAQRHLLSGLLVCGRCKSERVWQVASNGRQCSAYQCKDCNGIRRKQETTEAYVVGRLVERLAEPDALDWLAQDGGELDAARERVAGLRARLAKAADQYADEDIDADQLARISAKIRPQLVEAEAKVEAARPLPGAVRALVGLGSVELTQAAWDELGLDAQRAAIRALLTVTLLPSKIRTFDPSAIRIEWLGAIGA